MSERNFSNFFSIVPEKQFNRELCRIESDNHSVKFKVFTGPYIYKRFSLDLFRNYVYTIISHDQKVNFVGVD